MRNPYIKVLLTLFLLFLCVFCGNLHAGYLDFMSTDVDWQPQDYPGNQGVKSVLLDTEKKRMVLNTHFIGGDNNYGNGEVYLDVRYVSALSYKTSINLEDTVIYANVTVPGGIEGETVKFGGLQVFAKDVEGRVQYGTWTSITTIKTCEVFLTPRKEEIEAGYTDNGFDPARIKIVGIKFEIEPGLLYDGPVYINEVKFEPPLKTTPLLSPPAPPKLLGSGRVDVKPDGFYMDGKRYFLVGGNWQVLEYGQNFGTTAWYPGGNGISKHPNFVREKLSSIRRAGIQVLRVGLLTDGRTMFDKIGHVNGYNKVFQEDVRTFLDIVSELNMRVEFTLFDYLIAGRADAADDVWMRGHSEIMTDEALKKEFLDKFLVRFLKEFGQNPTIIGFDIISRPEWMVGKKDGGTCEDMDDWSVKPDSPVPGKFMKSFISDAISTIHIHAPHKLVTVGISSVCIPFVQDLDIDYLAIHHYPWMGDLKEYLPLMSKEKPWVLEEFPTGDSKITVSGYFDMALRYGGTGAMLWNLSPGIDNYTFSHKEQQAKLLELRKWVDSPRASGYPRIHIESFSYKSGSPVTIVANIIDDGVVQKATLHYRFNNSEFTKLSMSKLAGKRWEVIIGSEDIVASEVEYYISAIDNDGSLAQTGIYTTRTFAPEEKEKSAYTPALKFAVSGFLLFIIVMFVVKLKRNV